MATIIANHLKNGKTSFVATINGRRKKIAEVTPWKTGYCIDKLTLEGRQAKSSPFITYDRDDLEPVVISWAEQILGEEANIQ